MNAQTTTYTVQIQAGNSDQVIWQGLHAAENVEADETTTAEMIAEDAASIQNIAEGSNWRVCVWTGADADTGTEPAYIYKAPVTITIADLATELDTTTDIVRTYVEQLIGIDGEDATIASDEPVTNASGRIIDREITLTADAADAVRTALAAAEAAGVDDQILDRIADAADAVRQAQDIVSQREAARDELIREAMRRGVKVARVAAAAELSEPRLWQIRRGTRI